MFKGLYTALITPFKDGKIDEKAFANLVEWQIEQGVHGLVPCGTTGESATLSYEEHNRIISLCVEVARKRVKVVAGTGANSTDEAIMLTSHAKEAGADGALIVAPYYNRPTQEGLYQHYKAIAESVNIPIIIYNIPSRCAVDIADETIARLAKITNIVGVKDASGNISRVSNLRSLIGNDFLQLSGDDINSIAFNVMGGVGCFSVASNIVPKLCAEIQNKTLAGDYAGALEIHEKLLPLYNVMFCETNPAPVKYAASLVGLSGADLRLPLVQPNDANKAKIKAAIEALNE